MCSFRRAGAGGGGGVPRKGGPPPVTDGLTRERRRDGPERRLDAPRMYCVAVINPMSCPRGLVALTYPLVNALCPRPHFSRKRCSFRIANALNVSSTDWQNVHRVIGRPKGRGRGAGNRSGCLRGVGGEPTVRCFFLLIPTRRRTVPTRNSGILESRHFLVLPVYENAGRPIFAVSPDHYSLRSKLCSSACESQSFRVHRDCRSTFPVFGENKPPFVSPGSRRAAGQRLFPRGSCTTFVVSVVSARALLRAHKHPTLSTVVATRVVVFHSLRSFTF